MRGDGAARWLKWGNRGVKWGNEHAEYPNLRWYYPILSLTQCLPMHSLRPVGQEVGRSTRACRTGRGRHVSAKTCATRLLILRANRLSNTQNASKHLPNRPTSWFGQQPADRLPWFHLVTLLTKAQPADREWYAGKAIAEGWARTTLELHIRNRLLQRQGQAITNFDARLPAPHSALAHETLKDS